MIRLSTLSLDKNVLSTSCPLLKWHLDEQLNSAAKKVWRRGAFSCNDCIFKHSAGTEIEKHIKPHSVKAKIKTQQHSLIFCEVVFFIPVDDLEFLLWYQFLWKNNFFHLENFLQYYIVFCQKCVNSMRKYIEKFCLRRQCWSTHIRTAVCYHVDQQKKKSRTRHVANSVGMPLYTIHVFTHFCTFFGVVCA